MSDASPDSSSQEAFAKWQQTASDDDLKAYFTQKIQESPTAIHNASFSPIRQHTAKDAPKRTKFFRGCVTCDASFIALLPGKVGERGLWNDDGWYCSIECAPESLKQLVEAKVEQQPAEDTCPAPGCSVVIENLLQQSTHMLGMHPEFVENRRREASRFDGWEDA